MRSTVATVSAVVLGLTMSAASASAQVIGTFTWQLEPYCNRIVATVTQGSSSFELSGYEDQCGAARRAPLTGTAVQNPDGTVQFGISLTPPASRPVNVSATIDLGTLSGTWLDNGGHSGPLTFNGPGAGSPRPRAGAGELVAHAYVNTTPGFGFSYGFSAVTRPQVGLACVTPILPAGLTVADIYPHVTVEWNFSTGSDLLAYGQLSTSACPTGDVAVRTFRFTGNPVTGVAPSNTVGFFVSLYRR